MSVLERLLATARRVARDGRWEALVQEPSGERWHLLLYRSPDLEVWLLGWGYGQGVELHDHGGATGAYVVVEGALAEMSKGRHEAGPLQTQRLDVGHARVVHPDIVHDVQSVGSSQAVSIHCYSPALFSMNFYRLGRDGVPIHTRSEPADHTNRPVWAQPFAARTVDDLLSEARAGLRRLTPAGAASAVHDGAVLVDIRPEAQRAWEGVIPGARPSSATSSNGGWTP
jgi:hypothetical protein